MSHFQEIDLATKLLANHNGALRNCQHGGLMGIMSHFSASSEPAIVSLPTGAGKTELMFAVAFASHATRILIIEPSRFLRQQTKIRLENLRIFKEQGLLNPDAPEPRVKEVKTKRNDYSDWEELRDFDAAVACPQTTSHRMKDVSAPPDDLFDLVFIDEAHHAAAKTWRGLISSLSSARCVLFTATPFRRDRRRMPGRLVYHYPIGRALSDGIYRPLDFIPIPRGDLDTVDKRIAKAASDRFKEEIEQNPKARLLIRTDRISKCEQLAELYSEFEVDAKIINSDENDEDIQNRLSDLRNGGADGAVVVGMMAEGIDIPTLKVAALHAPPQSLPFTLQIAGRMSRNPDSQSGPATLVASPGQVHGEARRLFQEDRSWRDFIPDLVEEAVRDAHGDRAEVILDDPTKSPTVPETLKPFFSVEVMRFANPGGRIHSERLPLDPKQVRSLPITVESITSLAEFEEGCTVLLTESTKEPSWGKDSGVYNTEHNLTVLFHPPGSQLLFRANTSKRIAKALSEAVLDETKEIDPDRLHSALEDAQAGEYTAVGLENALGLTGSHPAYRMHMGAGSDSSVRPTDGTIYGPGHAVGKMISGEYRGIALQNRRVWAMRRDSLLDFVRWCNAVASKITSPGPGLPGLGFLASPKDASDLFIDKDRPIGIVVSDQLFGLPPSALLEPENDDLAATLEPQIEIQDYDGDALNAALSFRTDEEDISLSYSPDKDGRNWQVREEDRSFEIKIPSDGERISLEDFLNESPPVIIMPEGGAIRGSYGWVITSEEDDLSQEMFDPLEWDGVDIKKEVANTDDDKINVMEATIQIINNERPSCIVVVDDGAYEIADLIVIDTNSETVDFVHCKASSKRNPGNRIEDWYELFGQSCRSHSRVRASDLIQTIYENLGSKVDGGRESTKIVEGMGAPEDVRDVASRYRPNGWSFRVIAVQPGCSVSKLREKPDSHSYRGLRAVRDWLDHAGAEFHVWGSA